MKVQIVNSQINKQQSTQQQSPKFKGVLDSSLRFLATNQAVGANGVDLCSMVIPRTASDWLRRGPAAGMETGRRESMGTINDSALGAYGLGAGLITATAMGINDKYGTKINGIMSAPETMKILAENKADQLKQGKDQLEYFKDSLKSLKAYNPTSKVADTEGFVKLSSVFDDEGIEKIAKMLDEAVSNENVSFKDWESNKVSGSKQAIMNLITEKTGAQSNYVLSSKNAGAEALKSETNLASFLEDIYKVTESFNKPNVKKAFEDQIAKNASIKDNAYIKSASKFMKARSYGGFAIASAVGLSVQPINMYLTKLKTGSDGFVGVEGRQKDKSAGA